MNRQDGSEVCENIVISSTVYSDCSAHSYGIQESTSMEERIDHSYMETDFDSTSVDDKRKVLQEIEMVKCENFTEYDDIASSELDPKDTFLSGVSETYDSEGQQCLIVKEEIDLDQIKEEEVSTDLLESELPQDDYEDTCTDTAANIMFSESTYKMPISTVSSSNGISSEVVSGFRENSQLYHIGDGYFYHTIRERGNRRYLRCAIRSCPVRATMTLDKNAPIVISPDRPFHNHQPEYLRLRKTLFLQRIKYRAEVESTKISKIYKEEVARDPEAASLISEESVKQRMGRNRRNNRKLLEIGELEDPLSCNSNKLNEIRKQAVNLAKEELLLDCPDTKQVNTPSEVVSGFRESFTLYHIGDGYFYYTMRKRKYRRYLKCAVKSCRVRASMALYKNAPIKISPHSPHHSHQPDLLRLRKTLFIQKAKHRAEVESTAISEIYKEEAARDFEAALLISEECVKKRMARSRKRKESMKSLHKQHDGLNIKSRRVAPLMRDNGVTFHDKDGYFYTQNKINALRSVRYLKCSIKSCKTRASMRLNKKNAPVVISPSSPYHSHVPDILRLRKIVFIQRIKQRAKDETTPISVIYKEERARDYEASAQISEMCAKQRMQRIRRKLKLKPRVVINKFDEDSVPENYENNVEEDPQNFLSIEDNSNTSLDQHELGTVEVEESSQGTLECNPVSLTDEKDVFRVFEEKPAQKVQGFRDNTVLYHDGSGYFYVSNRNVDNVIYLQCSVKNCRVRASVSMEENSSIKLSTTSPLHNHQPDFVRLRLTSFMKNVTKRALSDLSTTITVIYNEEAEKDPEGAACISAKCAKQRMSRARKKYLQTLEPRIAKSSNKKNSPYSRQLVTLNDDKSSDNSTKENISVLQNSQKKDTADDSSQQQPMILENQNENNLQKEIDSSFTEEKVSYNSSSTTDCDKGFDSVQMSKCQLRRKSSSERDDISGNNLFQEKPSTKVPGYRVNTELYHDGSGFFYCSNRTRGSLIYLQCSERTCRVRASVLMEENAPIKLSATSPMHNHEPDFVRLRLKSFMEKARQRVLNEDLSVNTIYKEEAKKDPEGAATISAECAKQRLSRARKKHLGISVPERLDKDSFQNQVDRDARINENSHKSIAQSGTEDSQSEIPSKSVAVVKNTEEKDSTMLKELPSQKVPGFRKNTTLYHDGSGYFFTCNRTRGNNSYLHCCLKTCRVRATVGVEENSPIKLSGTSPLHNHQPDFVRLDQTAFMKRVRERTINEETPINDIYTEEALKDPKGAATIAEVCVKQRLSRLRKGLSRSKGLNSRNPSNEEDLFNSYTSNDTVFSGLPLMETATTNNQSEENNYLDLTSRSENVESKTLEEKPSEKVAGFRKNTAVYHDGSGYFYCSNRTRGSISYLQCCIKTCHVRASVGVEENSPIKLSATSPLHNHEPDFLRLHRTAFMERANHRAISEDTPINVIYTEEAEKDPEGAASISVSCAKQRMSRARQRHSRIWEYFEPV